MSFNHYIFIYTADLAFLVSIINYYYCNTDHCFLTGNNYCCYYCIDYQVDCQNHQFFSYYYINCFILVFYCILICYHRNSYYRIYCLLADHFFCSFVAFYTNRFIYYKIGHHHHPNNLSFTITRSPFRRINPSIYYCYYSYYYYYY